MAFEHRSNNHLPLKIRVCIDHVIERARGPQPCICNFTIRSPFCPVNHHGHLSQQRAERLMSAVCGLRKGRVVGLIWDYVEAGQERTQVAL
jgi:hypothetical protein